MTRLNVLACQKCIKDIEAEILNVTPAKKMPKTFIIDGEGNIGEPNIEYRRSETFLIDIMENICDRMDNAVKVKHKTTGEMMLFTLALADGKMNPLINDIDIPEDSGLGNNPKMYCEDMMDKYGDEILELFKVEENLVEKICTTITIFAQQMKK
ncbi:protein seele [Nilaparvata lugens]|uniref:protein seele n=1 Tax=Nilaparvata lugens TaxID=108931 RepID=UPI00193DC117|nr:protein seele [Nilaparvata lugens]